MTKIRLKKGKPIGVVKGLADYVNKIFTWFDNMRPGKGLTFNRTNQDFTQNYKYDVLLEAGAGINIACGGDEQPYIISTTGGSGGGAQLSVTGTDGNTAVGSNVTIAAASDTNLSALASDDGNGNITLTLGVYYK